MKDDLYVVKTRYEYRGVKDIEWTKWFALTTKYMTKSEAEEYIKNTKKLYNDIDKRTHLKHDYMAVPVSEYEKEIAETDRMIQAAQERDDKYFASEEWKELKHKKYVARKERKQHQEEYKKMIEELKDKNI